MAYRLQPEFLMVFESDREKETQTEIGIRSPGIMENLLRPILYAMNFDHNCMTANSSQRHLV